MSVFLWGDPSLRCCPRFEQRAEAAERYELPTDRIGVPTATIISARNAVSGVAT